MKKMICMLVAGLLTIGFVNAQGFSMGPKLGANIGKIDGAGFSDKYTLGYHLGAFMDIKFSKKLGIQAEVLWNQINADTASGFSSIYQNLGNQDFQNPRLQYLSIPLLLTFKPGKIISFHAGPQFGILLNKSQDLLQNGQNAFKNGDLSMLVGTELKILNLRFYGRYIVGLQSISDIADQGSWKSTGFQVGVGLGLF
jgi:hypothetical protein